MRTYKIRTRRLDFFVENNVMIEIKPLEVMQDAHLAQAKNYHGAYKIDVKLFIHFGAKNLEFKMILQVSESL